MSIPRNLSSISQVPQMDAKVAAYRMLSAVVSRVPQSFMHPYPQPRRVQHDERRNLKQFKEIITLGLQEKNAATSTMLF